LAVNKAGAVGQMETLGTSKLGLVMTFNATVALLRQLLASVLCTVYTCVPTRLSVTVAENEIGPFTNV
jgi:hypothetical protein